jgi:hypothetical protein
MPGGHCSEFLVGEELLAAKNCIDPQVVPYIEQFLKGSLVAIYFYPDDPFFLFSPGFAANQNNPAQNRGAYQQEFPAFTKLKNHYTVSFHQVTYSLLPGVIFNG